MEKKIEREKAIKNTINHLLSIIYHRINCGLVHLHLQAA